MLDTSNDKNAIYCIICGKELEQSRIKAGKQTCCRTCSLHYTNLKKRQKKLEELKASSVTNCVICGKPLTEQQILRGKQTCCISCGNKRYFNSLTEEQKQELKQKNSEAVKAAFKRPEVKDKLRKAIKNAYDNMSEEQKNVRRERMSEIMKNNWTKESYRKTKIKQISETNLKLWKSEEYRERQKKSHEWMKTDEQFKTYHRQRTSETTKKALSSPEVRKKISEGIKNAYRLNGLEITKKINNTKKLKFEANTSQTEHYGYELLKTVFPDVTRHYISEEYPFNCDYYVPSKRLYIEGHFHWTHGGRPYDSNSEECRLLLDKWKTRSAEHSWYAAAIKNWTYRDVLKRETAAKNNLNFVEVFSIQELKDIFNIKEN